MKYAPFLLLAKDSMNTFASQALLLLQSPLTRPQYEGSPRATDRPHNA